MVTLMKGRTTCPKCKKEFVLDLPEDDKKHQVVCPDCNNKFDVLAKCDKTSKGQECTWEEHGEPRKTILSATKSKTNKPMIAAIILICVFAVGIATTIFSEEFIESTLDVAAGVGLTSDVEIYLTNQTNLTIEDAEITWNGQIILHKQDGVYYKANVEPGIQTIEITRANYKTQRVEILVTPFFKSEAKIKLEEGDGQADDIHFDNIGCSIIIAIFTAFALFAMIACLKRQNVDVAIAGSFFGIFSFGFFFIGSILSIIAFVLIIMSRDEFRDASKGKRF
jgi:DNA-directed RNA polymerase subunit RPC12/RpoP